LGGWEPVFHPVLANGAIYAPGAGGTLLKIDKTTGKSLAQINPFSALFVFPQNTFVASPLTADAGGNIFYNVIELVDPATADPWVGADVAGAWLVKVTPAGTASVATYASLVPGAPAASATTCPGRFSSADALPWPPTPTTTPNTQTCGSQRPGVNVGPAIAADGTVYTVSRAHFDSRVGYLVAVNPDLTPRWQASLQHRLNDGCGVIVPIATNTTTPNTCRPGTTPGVDPTTNDLGSGTVIDQASSSPTVLPDGSILFGAITSYNGARGHMFKFNSAGNFLGSFDFGWDSTPSVYPHGGTYSIIIKDNHYETGGLYCSRPDPICQALPPGPYYITQLDANLNVEWQFQNTTLDVGHPNGYEWCINAPAVDSTGVVYVNSEDGNLYSLPQGHTGVFNTPQQQKFLKLAIGAAYTPLSIGADGRIYTQNDGHLLIVGN
jgi:outer membrane protein assembly factor BamB